MILSRCPVGLALLVAAISLSATIGKTDATEPSQNCSVWQLFTSDYQVFNGRNGADNSSYVRVNLDASAYEISNTTSYNGHIIYQACDGAENVDPLLFEESSSCDVEIDSERNQLLLHNCTEGEINPGDSRIILRSCLSFTDVCILDTINCTTYCAMEESGSSPASRRVTEPNEIANLWVVCPAMNLDEVLAVPSLECKRITCVDFIQLACSSLSVRCPQHIYHDEAASTHCSSHLNSNYSTPAVNEQGYFSNNYCLKSLLCLNCNVSNRSFCQDICEKPFQNKYTEESDGNFCSDDIEAQSVEVFCADYIITRNCSNLILSETDCKSSPERCASICKRDGVLGFYARGCRSEVFKFCVQYATDLLNSTLILTEEQFLAYIDVVTTFHRVFPGSTVTDLMDPLLTKLNDSSLLVNDRNLELLVKVFNGLFDDIYDSYNMSAPLYTHLSYQEVLGNFVTESAISLMRQLETLGELVSTDIIEGRRNCSYRFETDSLFFSIASVNGVETVDNKYRFIIRGDENTGENIINYFPLDGFLAEIVFTDDVLCGNDELKTVSTGCPGVVAVAVANRELLLRQFVDILYRVDQIDPSIIRNLASDLTSIQVFGVKNLTNKLIDNPVETTLRFANNFDNFRIGCLFWNQTKRSWSKEGVTTYDLINRTVRCTSTHLTIFTAFETYSSDDTLLILIYISCGISIFFLLATIFCIPFFLKSEMFRKVHFFVHFNLALVALLAYLILVIALNRTLGKYECKFMAMALHYFFLAAFSWMLCEGIMLYLMSVVVFSKLSKRWWFFMLIGYGLPAIPVIVTLGANWEDYIAQYACWLSANNGVGYGVVVPAAVILVINFVVLFIVLGKVYKTLQHRYRRGSDQHTESSRRTGKLIVKLFVATLVLAPLLGVTAISAVLYATVGSFLSEISATTADIFTWMFIICNFLQGFSMFFFHVVRSEQIWESSRGRVVKLFFGKCIPKKLSKSTTNSSQVKKCTLGAIDSLNRENTTSSSPKHESIELNSAAEINSMHPKIPGNDKKQVSELTEHEQKKPKSSLSTQTNPPACT